MAENTKVTSTEYPIYFEFIKNRWAFYAFSMMIFVITPMMLATRGLNWGMDFRGGTEFLLGFEVPKETPMDEETIRKTLAKPDFTELGDVQVFRVTNPSGEPNFSVRTKMQPDQIKGMAEKLARSLTDPAVKRTAKVLSTNSVGPVVGDSLRKNTLKAIFWSCVAILIYMSIQFEFRPGFLCTVGLMHDTFSVLLLFCVTQHEVDLTAVAALLTVLGYSMNDSIVILDRVRENQRLKRKMPLDELVNLSINQCLARTVYVGLTVVMTLVTLLFMGPHVLRGFSLAIIVGVCSGMTSTLSIVCPVLVDWHLWERSGRSEAEPKKA